MPLTDDDVDRISDVTAAKVLGRSWSTQGRTLAGSVEALLNITRLTASVTAVNELTGLVERILAEVSDDPRTDVTVPEAHRPVIARRIVERISLPVAVTGNGSARQ